MKIELRNEPSPPIEWPKAPPGTNTRLLPLAGTYMRSTHLPGQPLIYIFEEKNPGECKGGICVEVLYEKYLPNGERFTLNAHVNGNNEIRPNGYVLQGQGEDTKDIKDFGPAFQEFDDHLVKLGLLPPKDQNTAK